MQRSSAPHGFRGVLPHGWFLCGMNEAVVTHPQCVVPKGRKHSLVHQQPFPHTISVDVNQSPHSKRLEWGLAQGEDNFYRLEKNQLYKEEANTQPIGPTGLIRQTRSCHPQCGQMPKMTSGACPMPVHAGDISRLEAWHQEPQRETIRAVKYHLIQSLRSPRRKHPGMT